MRHLLIVQDKSSVVSICMHELWWCLISGFEIADAQMIRIIDIRSKRRESRV